MSIFRYLFLVRHSKSSCISSVWCSEPYLQFGVQIHTFSLAFRAISSVQHSGPLFNLTFGVISLVWNSKPLFVSSSAFRVIISPLVLAFKAVSLV